MIALKVAIETYLDVIRDGPLFIKGRRGRGGGVGVFGNVRKQIPAQPKLLKKNVLQGEPRGKI